MSVCIVEQYLIKIEGVFFFFLKIGSLSVTYRWLKLEPKRHRQGTWAWPNTVSAGDWDLGGGTGLTGSRHVFQS